ncbi:Arginase/deacetylase [Pleomassaria siparia CBS 279.74]|uniref:Arginase/deacetylase n=1 Tax=Pleomassaria siparia CBS 279.74 TaxID=1314801 RepID=A0A6G1JQT9_9PLEO|nr:Arginase/deacetylase [Pleomassaria siparia CBS 279.74]
MRSAVLIVGTIAMRSLAYSGWSKSDIQQPDDPREHIRELQRKWGSDWAFSGIPTFGHLDHVHCLTEPDEHFDIGIVGAPFDSAVTYRPGARMGPRAIRAASTRHLPSRSFHPNAGVNPYRSWAKVLDCGDIPITPIDNVVALRQMTEALTELGSRAAATPDHQARPRLIIFGGDHSLSLPALRALKAVHGSPMAVLHFDAHLDTLHPSSYPYSWASDAAEFNHGSMFWKASREGLVLNGSSVHAGLRTRLSGTDWTTYDEDDHQGYLRIYTDDIDRIGVAGIVDLIRDRIGMDIAVYLSIDIDVLDPAFAPGTGAPEPGGWTSRELIRILSGLRDLNIVGADIVEVAPAYDSLGGDTALTAASLAYEIITTWVLKGLAVNGGTKVRGMDGGAVGSPANKQEL